MERKRSNPYMEQTTWWTLCQTFYVKNFHFCWKKTWFYFFFFPDASSGTSLDWAKGKARIKYSFGLELRPANVNLLSSFGFLLPESDIIPVGKETFAGMKAIADAILKHKGLPPAPGNDRETKRDTCADQISSCSWFKEIGSCSRVVQACPATCGAC